MPTDVRVAEGTDWVAPDGARLPRGVLSAVPHLVIDTDIATDVDDLASLMMAHNLAKESECVILGIGVSSGCQFAPVVADAANHWHGRSDMPLGVTKDPGYSACNDWTEDVNDEPALFPRNVSAPPTSVDDAVDLYRQLLRDAADNSITFVTIGFLTNVSNLLQSEPDSIDSRTGMQLVEDKVKEFVTMGGRDGTREFNIWRDLEAADYYMHNCPVQVVWVQWEIGSNIRTGTSHADMPNHILRFSFERYHGWDENDGNRSFDQCAMLRAIRGDGHWYSTERGTMTLDDVEDDVTVWTADEQGRDLRVERIIGISDMEAIIEPLMWMDVEA